MSPVGTVPPSDIFDGLNKHKRDQEAPFDNTLGDGALFTSNSPKRSRIALEITIPSLSDLSPETLDNHGELMPQPISGLSDVDSLFDESCALVSPALPEEPIVYQRRPALRTAPNIRGLFFTPSLCLPQEIADYVTQYCLNTYFQSKGVNQVMLFARFSDDNPAAGLPTVLLDLLSTLNGMLLPTLPPETHALLFPAVPSRARQAILNLYKPGEGISPHVDLLQRFGDGIIGVSLGSGCVMQFSRMRAAKEKRPSEDKDVGIEERDNVDVYLPERSVIVLSEDARYLWAHGIGEHTQDYVTSPNATADRSKPAGKWIQRGLRLSITFRWLLPGADVVGESILTSPGPLHHNCE